MGGMQRLFFDVSYTRTQLGAVGITRTVRQLLEHLRAEGGEGVECIPVAFHSGGFRRVDDDMASAKSAGSHAVAASERWSAGLLRWLMGSRLRRVVSAAVPLPLLKVAWLFYNSITFDTLGRDAGPPVVFRPGDLVLLCDASWNYRAWVAARAAQREGAQTVLMVHDLIPLRHREFCAPLFTAVFRTWLGEMLACCDAVVCNSAATMHDLQAYAREEEWQLPPVSHFRLGSDVTARTDNRPVRPELLQITGTPAPCFAAVGSIESRKNYPLLMATFEQLWAEGKDVRLVVVGRPTAECGELADAMASHPERGRRFLPLFDASDGELNHVYAACRALVFPSLAEGFGLPLVEARTRGALVIASDIPVFRELADEGVLIFDRSSPAQLREHILALAASDRRRLVPAMRPFTWQDSARQLMTVAGQILQRAA